MYEEWFVPAVFAPLAREVLARTKIPAGARVLDIACGTGVVSRLVAARVGAEGRVVGLDFSPAMLAAARRAAAAEGLDIEWREGSALDLPFADESFDLVVCQMGMQFFPDRPRAAAEMHRVLAPGGRVVLSTWRGLDHHPVPAALARAVRDRFHSTAAAMPFALGDPAALAELLQYAGFADVSVGPVDILADYTRPQEYVARQITAYSAGIPALQGMAATERDALIAAIAADMADPVRDATDGDRLRFPMHGIVARGRR
jgi:ubiquinone/menaquinone biosynthesis C-methylase UbiE